MGKTTKYAIRGLTIGAALRGLKNMIEQRDRMQQAPGITFNWRELLQEAAKGAFTGVLIGGGIGAIRDYQNCLEEPVNTDSILYNILLKAKLSPSNRDYMELREKGEEIMQLIKQRFSGLLKREPMFMGSTERGTALCRKFDIDIGLLFLHDSFSSTAYMYDAVYDYARSLIGKYGFVEVRVQRKSVGIICCVNNKELKIDLVPCKATKGKGRSNEGYLCVNKKTLWGRDSTYTKTNIHLLNKQKLSPAQKNLVVLLKEWKHSKGIPLPSHLLENMVLDTFRYNWGRIPRTLTDKLVMVFDYIAENLNGVLIRSVENTNNILTNIPDSDKFKIINACKSAVDDYHYQRNSIINTIIE